MSRKLVEELARFLMIDVGQASVTVSQEELLQHVNAMGQNGLQLPCYNLEKLTFARLNLSGSNFAGSNLRGSSFVRTSLAKTNFQVAWWGMCVSWVGISPSLAAPLGLRRQRQRLYLCQHAVRQPH